MRRLVVLILTILADFDEVLFLFISGHSTKLAHA